MMQSKEELAPVPGVLATIAAGFDVTTKHFWLTLIPVLLDSFFWLGPRLSFRLLVERMAAFLQQNTVAAGVNMDVLLELAPRTNLFTSLSLPLLGIPSLMAGATPEKTPLATQVIELDNGWLVLLLFVVFNLIGLLFTAVYFGLIARAVRGRDDRSFSAFAFLRQVSRTWLQLMGLVVSFMVAAVVVYTPLMIVGALVSFLSQGLASIIILMGPLLLIWLLIYLGFTPHGMTLNGRSLWRAMIESFQLIRRYMLSVMTLLLLLILIGQAMDWALLLADDGSWLTWVSIWGHAFISTALVAATFIFYRDRHATLFGEQQFSPSASNSLTG